MNIETYSEEKTKKILKWAGEVSYHINQHDYDATVDSYCTLLRLCVEMTNTIKKKACEDCVKADIDSGLSKVVDVKVEVYGNVTKLTIASLPPIRIKGYTLYERETVEKIYLVPLIQEMHNRRAQAYKEKIVMCFFIHFGKGTRIIDHDNFDIKPLVDSIASVMLCDDSPEYMSLYMDGFRGEEDFTEIYLVPEREFVRFLLENKGD